MEIGEDEKADTLAKLKSDMKLADIPKEKIDAWSKEVELILAKKGVTLTKE